MQSRKILFSIVILFFIIVGLYTRLSALFDDYRLKYTIIEDGYYMVTVARNIALGHGMSISDGKIPTNGVQPLYTFVQAAASFCVNCDKLLTVKMVLLIQLLISLLIFWLTWKIGKILFKENSNASGIAILGASFWFAYPPSITHTSNGLETGFYTLLILLFIYMVFFRVKKTNYLTSVFTGAFLGIIFLARNDAVFFIAAFCLFIIFYKFYDTGKTLNNFIHVVIIGLTSVIIALPWLIYNLKFGSIMPISGHAELSSAITEPNYKFVPEVFMEYFLIFYSVPYYIKVKLFYIILCLISTAAIFTLLFRSYRNFTRAQKQIFFITVFFLLSLGIFYGIYFRTYYFLGRYFFPVSPFICLLISAIVFKYAGKIKLKKVKYTLGTLLIVYFCIVSYRNYTQDWLIAYFYLTDWVEKNVADDKWLASYQTGFLGYYHDKTLNLDGKVNPEALIAINENKIFEYIASKKPDYIIDNESISIWEKFEIIGSQYELIVLDKEKNIAVFRRKELN